MGDLFQVLGGLLGVVIGWWLNEFSTKRREKPKLCFKLTNTPDSELIEKGFRTKTSPSEYGIEIYNIGQSPYILESFSFVYKKKLLVDCYIEEADKTIHPYKSMVYTMTEQEAIALEKHCKEEKFKQCMVTAYDVEGKRFKAKLDVSWIALKTNLSPEDIIVTENE